MLVQLGIDVIIVFQKKTMENKKETYKFNCSACKEKTEFKVILVSRKFGVKLECLKCGKTIHRNSKYLKNHKNGN